MTNEKPWWEEQTSYMTEKDICFNRHRFMLLISKVDQRAREEGIEYGKNLTQDHWGYSDDDLKKAREEAVKEFSERVVEVVKELI